MVAAGLVGLARIYLMLSIHGGTPIFLMKITSVLRQQQAALPLMMLGRTQVSLFLVVQMVHRAMVRVTMTLIMWCIASVLRAKNG